MDLGLLQKEIGQRIGVCSLTITNWENGRTEPDSRHLPAILGFLGYDQWPIPAKSVGCTPIV